MTTSGTRDPGWLVALGMLAAVYLSGVGAVLLAPSSDPVATWWPAAGLAVALVCLAPRRLWPGLVVAVAVAGALANATAGRSLPVSLLFGLSNGAEVLVAAAILRRGGRPRPRLAGQDDFVAILLAAFAGGATAATGASLTVTAVESQPFLDAWLPVFAAHSAATLVLVPLAIACWTPRDFATRHVRVIRRTEIAAQSVALTITVGAMFWPGWDDQVTYLALPFLVWAALRFPVPIVLWQLAGLSVVATVLTRYGYGPFVWEPSGRHPVEAGLLTQGYLLCAAVMAMPLAIATEQRGRLIDRIGASERLFRRNFTRSLVGMLLLRGDSGRLEILDLNDTAARLAGVDLHELVGRPLGDVLDTDEPLDRVTAQMLDGDLEGWEAQTGLRDRPGVRVNVALSLLSRHPEPMFAMQILDVTAEYDALRRLEEAEKLTGATLDTAACIILVTDLDGTIVRVNAATTELTGYTEEELLGCPVWETSIAPPAGDPLVPPAPAVAGPVLRETDAITKTGEKRRIVWNHGLVADEQGQPSYAVLTGIDVTAERSASEVVVHLLEAAITTALVGIDGAGRITVINAGAQKLLGVHYLDMLGTPFVGILDPAQLRNRTGQEDPEAAFEALAAGIGPTGETQMRDWTWVGPSGKQHTMSTTLSVTRDSTGRPSGFLCIGRDVTEQRQSQEMLVAALDKERTAVERLRQLDTAKDEFVSTVSHELRTPVTSIIGYTEMLQDGSIVEPDPDQVPLLRTIARNGRRLIDVCNDLLLLSGLDSGGLAWERGTVDVCTLLDPVQEALEPLLSGRSLDLRVERPEVPLDVLGDRDHLERVLLNLLGNAVKFTEDGGEIVCSVDECDGEVRITVRDNGLGIPEDEQGQIFEKFFRSSTAQHRAIQGTGLGLSIVAAIVSAHGGRVSVRSAHLAGTTVTVHLPLRRPALRTS